MNAWLQQVHAWHEFYLLVGTSVAALTGLMFVVVSVGLDVIVGRPAADVRAFVTPIVVYFTSVLVASALMMMPHVDPLAHGVLLLLGGAAGLAYIVRIGVHRRWRENKLEWDDFVWYVVLPILGYFLILAAAIGLWMRSAFGLFTLSAAMIVLMVAGIRNAWDLILWFAQKRRT